MTSFSVFWEGENLKKIIITGSIYELYEYEKTIVGKGGHKEIKDLMQKEKNYQNQNVRRRNNVRRLVCANFTNENCKFLTLTFAENVTDIKACNLEFKNFVKRLKHNYKLENLKYISVIEFQKRGAVHYHVMLNIPYIPQKDLQKLWGNGFVFINKIDNVDNLGAYLVKYMTKDTSDIRLQGQKAFFHSKNLIQPIEITDIKYPDLYESHKMIFEEKIKQKKCTSVYESTYDTECLGLCYYQQYNLDRI